MIGFLRTALFTLAFYLGSVPYVVGAFLIQYLSVEALRTISQAWGQYHYWCARLFLGLKVEVQGDLTKRGVIYAIKHESMFETIEILRLFHRPVVIAKKELADIPLWGRVARCFGMIYVDRDGGAKALRQMLAEVEAYKQEGRPIVIFPEGTRTPHGERAALQSGFAGIYRLFKLPVMPVAMDSGRFIRKGRFVIDPGTITWLVGEEIPVGLGRDDMEARVQDALNALNSDAQSREQRAAQQPANPDRSA